VEEGPWEAALQREGHRCEKCGRTEEQARAAGTWLEVHPRDGHGVRAKQHDLDRIEVLCRTPCHLATLRAASRPTLEQWKAEIVRQKAKR